MNARHTKEQEKYRSSMLYVHNFFLILTFVSYKLRLVAVDKGYSLKVGVTFENRLIRPSFTASTEASSPPFSNSVARNTSLYVARQLSGKGLGAPRDLSFPQSLFDFFPLMMSVDN